MARKRDAGKRLDNDRQIKQLSLLESAEELKALKSPWGCAGLKAKPAPL